MYTSYQVYPYFNLLPAAMSKLADRLASSNTPVMMVALIGFVFTIIVVKLYFVTDTASPWAHCHC